MTPLTPRTPLDDVRELAEDLLREATLASAGMQYAERSKVLPEHEWAT